MAKKRKKSGKNNKPNTTAPQVEVKEEEAPVVQEEPVQADLYDEEFPETGIRGLLERKLTRKVSNRLIVAAIAAIMLLLGFESFKFAYRITNGSAVDPYPGKEINVYIHDSMSDSDVATMLYEKGLIVSKLDFVIQAKIKNYKPSKYAGSYTLNTSMNAESQLNELMTTVENKQ